MTRYRILGLFLLFSLVGGGVSYSAPFTTSDHTPPIVELTFGNSGQGRPITGVRIGEGPRSLWLIGDTHGLPEANTYQLVLALIDHFRAHPEEVPPGVRLYLVPTVNPDGLALGTRFNARSVDLNRNMNTGYDSCPDNDWRHTVEGAYGLVSDTGGPAPESEVETQLVREMLQGASAVIFYHSDGGVVFPAACEHAPSIALAQAYASASGYTYSRFWGKYTITGGMHDWAGSLGIAAITPELATGELADVEENLAGVRAILARSDELIPLPEPVETSYGVAVNPFIWRYWRSHGGEEVFGPPISPALEESGAVVQYFEKARLEFRSERLEAVAAFTTTPGGRGLWTERLLDAPAVPFQLR